MTTNRYVAVSSGSRLLITLISALAVFSGAPTHVGCRVQRSQQLISPLAAGFFFAENKHRVLWYGRVIEGIDKGAYRHDNVLCPALLSLREFIRRDASQVLKLPKEGIVSGADRVFEFDEIK